MEALDMTFAVALQANHPQITVDLATINSWHAEAMREIEQTLMDTNSWYFQFNQIKRKMKLIYDKENVQGYVADYFAKTAQTGDIPFRIPSTGKHSKSLSKVGLCQAKIDNLSLKEIADSLYSDTTSDFRSVCASLYQENFLDSAVLQVEKSRTKEDFFQFVGMRWIALQTSTTGIGTTREYILFDSSGTSVDALGRKVLYSYFESKSLTPFDDPDQQTSLSYTSRIFLLREEKGGIVYYSRGVLHRLGDRQLPSWLYVKEMIQSFAQSFAVMRNIGRLADLRAILETIAMRSESMEVTMSESKHCQVCHRKFSFMRLRYYCRSCGGNICRRCTVSLRLFNEANQYSAALAVVRDRFCINCVLQAREGRAQKSISRPNHNAEYMGKEEQKTKNEEQEMEGNVEEFNILSMSTLDLFIKPEVHRESMTHKADERSARPTLANSLLFHKKPQEESLTLRHGSKGMDDLSKSIAQQEALLLSLLAEQRKRATAFVRTEPPTANHFSDSERFEIIS
ncbi:hypothetical protein ABG067_004897 [Albugo candida]